MKPRINTETQRAKRPSGPLARSAEDGRRTAEGGARRIAAFRLLLSAFSFCALCLWGVILQPARAQLPRTVPPTAAPASIIRQLPPEARYWWERAVGTTARNPAQALIVSRRQFQRLRALRSWQDFSALRDYVEWADRAEAAGFDGREVVTDVSANDLVLLRVPYASVRASVKVRRDPLGYAVLDPGRVGAARILVTITPSRASIPDLPAGLPSAPVPMINMAVREGSIVAVYGQALAGRRVRVFSRQGEGQIVYSAPNQINARVPSVDGVMVEVDGMRSDWAEVQR